MLPAVCNEICRRNDRQGVNPRDAEKFRRLRHGAVERQDLTEPSGVEHAGQLHQIYRRLCGTAVLQHAPRVGYPGEDVSGHAKARRCGCLFREGPQGRSSVRSARACCRFAEDVYGDPKVGRPDPVPAPTFGKRRDGQLSSPLAGAGEVDDAATVRHHEVHGRRGCGLCRYDQISVSLVVHIACDDDELSGPKGLECLGDRREAASQARVNESQ